jgi:GNAT superfamily N-acetyltransferase
VHGSRSVLLPSRMPLRSGICSSLSIGFSACRISETVFEAYIERALAEEIDRITAYYGERNGGFWVAVRDNEDLGTFGLERASNDAMELSRMYVDPSARRKGRTGAPAACDLSARGAHHRCAPRGRRRMSRA